MTYYKAFDENLCCRGLQFSIGQTKMCETLLCCWNEALACLQYSSQASRFCEVMPEGDTLTEGNKTFCEGVTVVKEIVGSELASLLSGTHSCWYGEEMLKKYSYVNGKLKTMSKCRYKNGELWEMCTYSGDSIRVTDTLDLY